MSFLVNYIFDYHYLKLHFAFLFLFKKQKFVMSKNFLCFCDSNVILNQSYFIGGMKTNKAELKLIRFFLL